MTIETLAWAFRQQPGDPLAKLALIAMADDATSSNCWSGRLDQLSSFCGVDSAELEWAIDVLNRLGLIRQVAEQNDQPVFVVGPWFPAQQRPRRKAASCKTTTPSRKRISQTRLAWIRLVVYRRSNYRCVRCGWGPAVPEDYDGTQALYEGGGGRPYRFLELDHIFPHSKGGKFEIDNLQALCGPCNASKGARTQ